MASTSQEEPRAAALTNYRKKLMEHREMETKVKDLRLGLKEMDRAFNKTEDDIKALQSVGQIIGSVLKQLDEDR
ncbi:26S proteasome subunit rpt4, partial [Haplosporangium bisporale]